MAIKMYLFRSVKSNYSLYLRIHENQQKVTVKYADVCKKSNSIR